MCEFTDILKNVMLIILYGVIAAVILTYLIEYWIDKKREVIIPEVIEPDDSRR